MLRALLLFIFITTSAAKSVNNVNYETREVPANTIKNNTNDAAFHRKLMPKEASLDQQIEFYKFLHEASFESLNKLLNSERKLLFLNLINKGARYPTLEEINSYLNETQRKNPQNVEIVTGGKSSQGRNILGVKLFGGKNRLKVVFEGGIHAREWISPATVLYIIQQLLTSEEPLVKDLARRFEFHIFPVINPDGYAYTHEDDGNRNWRKTMSKYSGNDVTYCFGADLNRNFDYRWGEIDTSSNRCDENYGGEEAFSEIESKTFSKYLTSIQKNLFAYIAFHSYGQFITYPYGNPKEHADNDKDLRKIVNKAAEAIKKRHGVTYVTGDLGSTIYPTSGGSVDWVKSHLNVPLTLLYELRDTGLYGFFLPPSSIIPTGEEIMDSLIALFAEARNLGYPTK